MEDTSGKVEGRDPVAGVNINPHQMLSLTVTLSMLERILFSLEDLCSGTEARQGIIVSLASPLSPRQRAHLEEMTTRAREVIATLSMRFGIRHETADLAREVHGRLVEMWATLEDTTSYKLRGYGAVDPGLAAQLDPGIKELIRLVLAMDGELFGPDPEPEQGTSYLNAKEGEVEQ